MLFGISYQFCTCSFFIIFATLFVFLCSFFLSFFSFFFSLTSYFWNSKIYSRFLNLAFWYMLSILYLQFFLYNFCDFFLLFFPLCFFLFFFYITSYICNSKLYSRFLIYAFWYLISILYMYFLYNFCDIVFVGLFSLFIFLLLLFLTLYFWNSKLYSRFLIFAFWY